MRNNPTPMAAVKMLVAETSPGRRGDDPHRDLMPATPAAKPFHPRAGRLDLLLQDRDSNRRYEVEIQLGSTDESHIIRTIEYWDIERKRYPQYDHTAVIVAEDITSRFLNVISLFNGTIPLVAIQMNALKAGDHIGLVFTTVMDQVSLGLVEEDEEVHETTDRAYWESRSSKKSVAVADQFLEIARKFDPALELKYNKFYIGLAKNGIPSNFVIIRPKKAFIRIEPRLKNVPQDAGALGKCRSCRDGLRRSMGTIPYSSTAGRRGEASRYPHRGSEGSVHRRRTGLRGLHEALLGAFFWGTLARRQSI